MKFSGQLHDPVPHLRGKSPSLQDLEEGGLGGEYNLLPLLVNEPQFFGHNNITLQHNNATNELSFIFFKLKTQTYLSLEFCISNRSSIGCSLRGRSLDASVCRHERRPIMAPHLRKCCEYATNKNRKYQHRCGRD
jgi:hypothetical protein